MRMPPIHSSAARSRSGADPNASGSSKSLWPDPKSFDLAEWEECLRRIGDRLKHREIHTKLELFGPIVLMRQGMQGRVTANLDVWKPGSRIPRLDVLREAAEAVGLRLFEPGDTFVAGRPALRIANHRGSIGPHTPVRSQGFGTLVIEYMPFEVQAASMLADGLEEDFVDLHWMKSQGLYSSAAIAEVIRRMPDNSERGRARENAHAMQANAGVHAPAGIFPRQAAPQDSQPTHPSSH